MSRFTEFKAIIKGDTSEQAPKKFQKLVNNTDGNHLQQEEIDLLLRWAVQEQKKNFNIFFTLLKKMGANINFIDKGQKKSILMIACEGGSPQIVQTLVNDQDLDFKHEDSRKKNCLFYAIENKNKDKGEKYIRMILKKAPQLINWDKSIKRNSIPLVTAIQKGKTEIVKTLLELGADPNQKISDNGNSPIYEAVKLMKLHFTQANKQIVQYLLDKGADPTSKNKQNKSALDVAEKYQQMVLKMLEQSNKNTLKPDLSISTAIERQQMFAEAASIFKNYQHLIQMSEFSSESSQCQELVQIQPFQQAHYFNDSLSRQIIEYARQCELDQVHANKELQRFMDMFKPISDSLDLRPQIYGSFATKLWLKHCDIDLLLIPKRLPIFDNVSSYLDQIYSQLLAASQNYREFRATILKSIKVPMIRVEMIDHNSNNYWKKHPRKFDITIMDSNHNGQQHVLYISQLLHCYPNLRPLFYVIKKLSYSYKLNDPKNGGVRSYALILMIAYYLQQTQCNANLGNMLLGFLYKYGYIHEYDFIQTTDQHKSLVLNLPDPINMKNNVGNQTDAFSLQRMLKTAYIVLHTKDCRKKLGYLFQSRNIFTPIYNN